MFKLHRTNSAKTESIEYIAGTLSEAFSLGEGLVMSSGLLTKVGATATPEYICLGARASDDTTSLIVPVKRVFEDEVYETVFSADASAVAIGTKVTIDSTGLKATATDTSGVFYIIEKLGDGTAGTYVRGLFRR